jgi:predicted site-specific integrase-resolvase
MNTIKLSDIEKYIKVLQINLKIHCLLFNNMKAYEVMKLLQISRGTLYNYTKDGKIKVNKLDNGYYDYDEDSVFKIIKKDPRINVIYARVSIYKQKKDLENQINKINNFCNSNNIHIDKIYSDINSGLDLDRKSLNDLIDDIINLKIKNVYITHNDRLTRLSFNTIKHLFDKFGTNIIQITKNKQTSNFNNDNEIFEELISLMHIFSTTMYSNRRKNKINIYKNDIENFISNE